MISNVKVGILSALLKEGARFVAWREMQRAMLVQALEPDKGLRSATNESWQRGMLKANVEYLRCSRRQVFGLIRRLSQTQVAPINLRIDSKRGGHRHNSHESLPSGRFKGKPTIEQYVSALVFLFKFAGRPIIDLTKGAGDTESYRNLLIALLTELRELIEFERSRNGRVDQSPQIWRSLIRGLRDMWVWIPEAVALTLDCIAPIVPKELRLLCGEGAPRSIDYKVFVAELIAEHSASKLIRQRCQNELIDLIEEVLGRDLYLFGAAYSLEVLLEEGWWEPQLGVLVDTSSIPQIANSFGRVIPQLGKLTRAMRSRLYHIVYAWTLVAMNGKFALEFSDWLKAGVFEHPKLRQIQFKGGLAIKSRFRDQRWQLRFQMLDEVERWICAAIAWRIIHVDYSGADPNNPGFLPTYYPGYGFRSPLLDITLKAKHQCAEETRRTVWELQLTLWGGKN